MDMAQFMVRVELHGADEDDYETLHEAMEDEGFARRISSDDGELYHLPTAEYYREGDLSRQDVLDEAKSAVAKTKKKAGILVTRARSFKWFGLKKV
jgi:hypothetical protein